MIHLCDIMQFFVRRFQVTDLPDLKSKHQQEILDGYGTCLVAESCGKILGWVFFKEGKTSNTIVDFKARFDPVYKSLFHAASNKRTYFHVSEKNLPMHNLLKRHGWKYVNTLNGKYVFLLKQEKIVNS